MMPRNLSLPEFSRGIASPTTSPKVGTKGKPRGRTPQVSSFREVLSCNNWGAGLGSRAEEIYEEMIFAKYEVFSYTFYIVAALI